MSYIIHHKSDKVRTVPTHTRYKFVKMALNLLKDEPQLHKTKQKFLPSLLFKTKPLCLTRVAQTVLRLTKLWPSDSCTNWFCGGRKTRKPGKTL